MQFTNAYALLSVLRLIKITEATWHAAAQTSCSALNSSTWTKLDQQFDNPIRDWTRSFKPSNGENGDDIVVRLSQTGLLLTAVDHDTGLMW